MGGPMAPHSRIGDIDIEGIISSGAEDRSRSATKRSRLALGVSLLVTIIWLVFVTANGHWDRVGRHWASAVTMVFGSFVAGATPQGGGAVAFPVFTKILEVPAEVARSFSLAIQSIGMGAASLAILINRRAVELRALLFALPSAVVGFFVGYIFLSDAGEPFAPSLLPGPYVKVGFTLIVAATAFVTYLGYRVQLIERLDALPPISGRLGGALILCGLFGGIASALVGSGADVALYLGLVVLAGLSPRVGVATSVLLMTLISFLGLAVYGLLDRHLGIGLDSAELVNRLGSQSVGESPEGTATWGTGAGLESGRYDLFGLWLAAAPVVAWGAPLGSFVSSRVTDRRLVNAVVALAAVEVATTIIFLDDLRTDPALAAFGIIGLIVTLGGLAWIKVNRRRLLGLPEVDLGSPMTRSRLDVGPGFNEQLEQRPDDDGGRSRQ